MFSGLSFIGLPPVAWGAVVAVLFVLLLGIHQQWWQWIAITAVVVMLLIESMSAFDIWSPYYKITAIQPPGTHGTLSVSANNIPHQTLYPISTFCTGSSPSTSSSTATYRLARSGTCSSSERAPATTSAWPCPRGARHVGRGRRSSPDLIKLGKEHNPEHAYQSPQQSRVHIDDGRAFLQNTGNRYSLIIFALPDSLTLP